MLLLFLAMIRRLFFTNTPAERTLVVPAESRTFPVQAELRTLVVPAESRTFPVQAELRTLVVPAESRTFIVDPQQGKR